MVPEARLYRRIATEVLFNVLEIAQQRGIIDRYAVKGGMALEVRFGMRARASRDVDVSVLATGGYMASAPENYRRRPVRGSRE